MSRSSPTLQTAPARWSWAEVVGVCVLLGMYGCLVAVLASRVGITTDERGYLFAGRWIATQGNWEQYVTRLHGPIPFYANQLTLANVPLSDYSLDAIERARLAMVPFGLLAALVVFLWSRAAFGRAAAFLSLTLFVCNPMMLGYGAIIAVDMAHSAGAVLALFLLWRYVKRPTVARLAAAGIGLGLAFATKYLALFYGPVAVVGVASATFIVWRARRTRALAAALAAAVAVTGVSIVTLHATYGLRVGFAWWDVATPHGTLTSPLLHTPVLSQVLAILPEPYLRGLDFQIGVAGAGPPIYLNGRFARGHWDYFLWSFLLKTPEVVIALLGFVLWRRPARWAHESATSWIVGAAVLLPLLYLSLIHPLQIGIRYMLPAYPLLFVLFGSVTHDPLLSRPGHAWACIVAVAVLSLGESIAQWPNLLGYFNVVSGGPGHAYRHFRESNSDWGQLRSAGLQQLEHSEREPFLVLHPGGGPRFGRIAAYVLDLGVPDPDEPTRSRHWLDPFEPVRHVGAAWYLFDVSPPAYERVVERTGDDRVRADLALAYLAAGDLGRFERHVALLTPARARPLQRIRQLQAAYRESGKPGTLLALSTAWAGSGRADKAVELLSAERVPDIPGKTFMLAASLYAAGKRSEALAVVETAADRRSDPRNILLRGLLYNQSMRFQDTLDLLDASDTALPDDYTELRQRLVREARDMVEIEKYWKVR